MNTQRLVIIDGVRTPFCKAGTDLAALGADELGRIAVSALLARTGLDPALVDEVIFGCVGQPADAANIARVIALRAGLPEQVPAMTVHRNCASGFEAFTQAFERLNAGEVFIVGGAESMSRYPLLYPHAAAEKFGRLARAKTIGAKLAAAAAFRPSDFKPRPGLLLGLTDPVCGMNMGETAELLAREFGVTRAEQDQFASRSHNLALTAKDRLADEITPVFPDSTLRVPRSAIQSDNGPRTDSTPDKLATLRPVFDRRHGTVTAGNASQVTDGAVALLVMSERKAEELGLRPLGALVDYAYAGCDPTRMGLGPVFAIHKLELGTGLTLADADVIEINEAFAAQTLAVLRALESDKFNRKVLHRAKPLGAVPADRLNINGGAIALGHPVGATGGRLVLTVLKELKRRQARRALVSLCVGGGQGGAIWLEAS
jgi:acetyl-CoA acetyltransferase family protein